MISGVVNLELQKKLELSGPISGVAELNGCIYILLSSSNVIEVFDGSSFELHDNIGMPTTDKETL